MLRHNATRAGARWVLIVACVAFAYRGTFAALAAEMRAQTLITYLPIAVVLVIIAAIGISLRNEGEPPIYDRQTDVIVGLVLLTLAISFQAMLNARYAQIYLAIHIDTLSMWIFLLGATTLMFGLRPTARYRWAWLLLFSIFPLPFRISVLALGGSRTAAGFVVLILAVAASAVAVGRTRRRMWIGVALSGVIGLLLLVGMAVFTPDAMRFAFMAIPSVGAALVTGATMYIEYHRGQGSLRPIPHRPVNSLTAPSVVSGAVVLVAAAVIVGVVTVPVVTVRSGPQFARIRSDLPLTVPYGWRQADATALGFNRYFGKNAKSVRQTLQQTSGSTQFDKRGQPRTVVVDSMTTYFPLTLDVYTPALIYDSVGDRFSSPRTLTLLHGVPAQLQTVVDDRKTLTYNRLIMRWNNGPVTTQVILLSVDNHEPGAPFPQPARNASGAIDAVLAVLFRGNAVTEDQTPSFKDKELLTMLGNELIDAQRQAADGRQ